MSRQIKKKRAREIFSGVLVGFPGRRRRRNYRSAKGSEKNTKISLFHSNGSIEKKLTHHPVEMGKRNHPFENQLCFSFRLSSGIFQKKNWVKIPIDSREKAPAYLIGYPNCRTIYKGGSFLSPMHLMYRPYIMHRDGRLKIRKWIFAIENRFALMSMGRMN